MRHGGAAHGSPFAPKIFGVYDSELFPFINQFEAQGIRTFIDVGSAEGYFACGGAWRHCDNDVRVYSFELQEAARAEQLENGRRNGVEDLIALRSACDTPALREVLAETRERAHQPWMLCDIEGCEYDLLQGEFLELLQAVPAIVEVHDFVRAGAGNVISERFSATHQITRVEHRRKTAGDINPAWLRVLSRLLLLRNPALLGDGRPPGNYWYILEPVRP